MQETALRLLKIVLAVLVLTPDYALLTGLVSTEMGCYRDTWDRDMTFNKHMPDMTPEKCISFCYKNNYKYAGLQHPRCSCGDHFGRHGKAEHEDCHKNCPAENGTSLIGQFCGRHHRNLVFSTGAKHSTSKLKPLGCFRDRRGKHDLPKGILFHTYMRKEFCYKHCSKSGFKYFGMQSSWCLCGNSFGSYGKVDMSYCSFKCFGDRSQSCGGRAHNIIYPTVHHKKPMSERKELMGCYIDNTVRDLPFYSTSSTMNVRTCVTFCHNKKFSYAGLQSGTFCFCGDSFGRYGKTNMTECETYKCPTPNLQKVTENCGGHLRNLIYKTGAKQLSASAKVIGCYQPPEHSIGNETRQNVTLFAMLRRESCFRLCAAGKYKFFGLEVQKCHCMDDYKFMTKAETTDCSNLCFGDWKQMCGSTSRYVVYSMKGGHKKKSKLKKPKKKIGKSKLGR